MLQIERFLQVGPDSRLQGLLSELLVVAGGGENGNDFRVLPVKFFQYLQTAAVGEAVAANDQFARRRAPERQTFPFGSGRQDLELLLDFEEQGKGILYGLSSVPE